jgi:hypothetical protein
LSVPFALLVYLGARFVLFLTRRPSLHTVALAAVLGVLYYLASLVLTAGTVRIISDAYLGRTPRLREALSLGVSKLGPLIGVGFGKGIVVMLITVGTFGVTTLAVALAAVNSPASILLVIGSVAAGFWFGTFVLCGYGVTTPVIVLEDLAGSFDAFGRSWALTRGFKGKVLGLSMVALLLTNTLPSLVLQGVGSALTAILPALGFVITALGYALPLILTPVIAAVITLMYYDLRVRREAFDLQMLGEELGIV